MVRSLSKYCQKIPIRIYAWAKVSISLCDKFCQNLRGRRYPQGGWFVPPQKWQFLQKKCSKMPGDKKNFFIKNSFSIVLFYPWKRIFELSPKLTKSGLIFNFWGEKGGPLRLNATGYPRGVIFGMWPLNSFMICIGYVEFENLISHSMMMYDGESELMLRIPSGYFTKFQSFFLQYFNLISKKCQKIKSMVKYHTNW